AGDDRRDAALAREARETLHRKELTRQVRDVAEVQDSRLRGDRALEPLIEILLRRGHGKLEPRYLDLVAPLPLVPRRQHARVILIRRDDLVAGLQVDAVLHDLQRLARVARDGDLFRIAAE